MTTFKIRAKKPVVQETTSLIEIVILENVNKATIKLFKLLGYQRVEIDWRDDNNLWVHV